MRVLRYPGLENYAYDPGSGAQEQIQSGRAQPSTLSPRAEVIEPLMDRTRFTRPDALPPGQTAQGCVI